MKNILLLSFFFLSVFLCGCYEDKGNYHYTDIQSIEIESFDYIQQTIGDTIKIEPEFNIDIPENASHISYKWTVNGETRPDDPNWNSRNFMWIADQRMNSAPLILEVTDNRYEVKYMQQTSCSIKGEFDAWMAWVILSEDENENAMLSFYKLTDYEYSADYTMIFIKDVKVYKDLYPSRNQGATLGQGPLTMLEHYSQDRENTVGNYWIFTQSGATDLEGEGFTKDVDLNQTFMGGVPAGVTIQGGVCMKWVDVLYDQQGHLYTRVKSDDELFNSDYFLPDPLKYQGQVLEQCQPILGRYMIYTSGYTPIVDRKNKRMLAIIDGDTGNFMDDPLINAAEIVEFPTTVENAPDNYIPLHNFNGYEVVDMQYILYQPEGAWSNKPGFIVLFKDENGQLYLEEFMLERGNNAEIGNYLTVSNVRVYPVNGLTDEPQLMANPPCYNTRYSFFAVGNQLWIFDRDTETLNLYKEFDARITALEGESDFKNKFLTVGLENGEFFVMNIVNAKNLPEDQRVGSELPQGVRLGKIMKINYKIGNGTGSWN